jgi:hypothetical protein
MITEGRQDTGWLLQGIATDQIESCPSNVNRHYLQHVKFHMGSKADEGKGREKWSRADKVNGIAALIACLGLVLGVGLPGILHLVSYLKRSQASITWPVDNSKMTNNTFGAYGTAENIPADADLWLIVRSGIEGRWYPIQRLRIVNGSWHVGKKWICPAPGPQELVIYLVPDSEEGQLYAYQTSGAQLKGLGINSIPLYSTVKATASVQIPRNVRLGC